MPKQKRILTVQDISCIGQCSLTVALPIISSFGIETAILPSAVLSTHTGNWKGFTFRDLTDDMPAIIEHWQKNRLFFDAVYTGYIGSARQFEYIGIIRDTLLEPEAPVIIDPAMADGGKLYTGFDTAFVAGMKKFVKGADYLLPNITEAAFLTGNEFRAEYDRDYIEKLVKDTYDLGCKNVILTGVSYSSDLLGVCVYNGNTYEYHFENKIDRMSHGTGDIFASVFTSELLNGKTALESAASAARFTCQAILATPEEGHPYGVNFESVIRERSQAKRTD